jgi:hypothetical protein
MFLWEYSSLTSVTPCRVTSGGSWTEECESDDEEEELTEEEMAEAIAEVASLTNSYTSSPRLVSYCNGDGLIHKFTNFEVSMLS